MDKQFARWIKLLFLLLAATAVLAFLMSIGELVRLVIIAALLAYILEPLASFLESRGLSRVMATAVIFIGIISAIALFVFLLLPTITHEIRSIQAGIQSGKATQLIQNLENFLQTRLAFLGLQNLNLSEKVHQVMVNFGNQIFNYLLNIVSLITNLVIIPFIIFFLIKDGREIKRNLIRLVPNKYFEFSLNLLHKMDMQLGNYLRGQFLDALIVGILSILALWLLDVKYFVLIGAFAGLANLIPYVGPIAGALPAIAVVILESGDMIRIVYIAIAFAIVQLIDNVLVQPLVVAKTVNMHPLVVMFVVIIGGKFFGVLGMLLSVPATGVLKVVIQESIANFRKYRFE
ncbi:MAG: AI-2E family transporter [Calditrichaeota bacterium]|nr:AI-2E family transporter [Calditrichota bacterium]